MRTFNAKALVLLSLLYLPQPAAATPASQRTFATPQDAANALFAATQEHDRAALRAIFGPDSDRLLSSGDNYADAAQESRFADAYRERHALVQQNQDHLVIQVGANDWPLPIPIVEDHGRWRFDTQAGDEELIDRRIGRNELAAIRTLLACVDAQHEFFARMKEQTGTGYYADRIISAPGQHDGLYWPAASGQPDSPLRALIEAAQGEGYPGELINGRPYPYQGYYFRILHAQGEYAPGGQKNYFAENAPGGGMTNGFAMIAWPASYGASGIMTFLVSEDGVVFQKDLGPDTGRIAGATMRFDPDLSWTQVVVADQ
jgi:Protein of unknown function (DUF2950)